MGRAIVRDAELFLMDEPLSNLDAKLRVQMRAEIASLQRQMGITTVYVTHDQVEAMTMGHRVAVLRLGELQQVAAPQDLYDNPDNVFVAGFIGTPPMTLFHAGLTIEENGARLKVGPQEIWLPREVVDGKPGLREKNNQEIIAGVRAEDIYPQAREGLSTLNASVVLAEALGSSVHVTFALEGTPVDESRLGSGLAKEAESEVGRLSHATDIEGTAVFPPRGHYVNEDPIQISIDPTRMQFFDLDSGIAIR
jgi:multiple sugar transport system ATP-binding protein